MAQTAGTVLAASRLAFVTRRWPRRHVIGKERCQCFPRKDKLRAIKAMKSS